MSYSTIDKPSDYFNTVTYTGTAGGQTISGVGNQPDFIWVKQRGDAGYDHSLHNSVSGMLKQLISNSTSAEITNTDTVTSTNADGFVLGADTAGPNANSNNQDGKTYVAWNWKAGSAVSGNTTGSGTSKSYTGSVNTAAGFSIIGYGGNGTAGHTIPHNLSATPDAIIVKNRSVAWNWSVYHKDSFTSQAAPGVVYLNTTAAKANDTNVWGNSSVTINSTVFSVGDYEGTNLDGSNLVAYCFAQKQGYSKFGSYTGNASTNGPFVNTGFKPAFVMVKRINGTSDWLICDDVRNPSNVVNKKLFANTNGEEDSYDSFDFVSNGFKITSSGTGHNASGADMIYMAFAENPLVGSNFVPTTAR